MAFLGGHILTGARWISTNAIAVSFTAPSDGMYRQLYAGRTMIGITSHPTDREVTGQLVFSQWPQRLSLVAVDGTEKLTDFGATLGVWPHNKVRISVSASSYPADADRLEITAGRTPSGSVDSTNILGQIILEGDGTYEFITTPLSGSGTWNFEVTPYDDKGNAGTALEASADVVAYPPDVVLQADNARLFGYSIASQTLNLSVVLP